MYPLRMRGQASGTLTLPTNVTPTQNDPTFPDQPVGFTPISLFSLPDLFNPPAGTNPTTLDFQFFTPFQVTYDEWQTALAAIKDALAAAGAYDVVAYGVWEEANEQIQVPSQITLLGVTVTPPFAGTTLLTGYVYRVWILWYDNSGVSSGYRGFRARGQLQLIPIVFAAMIVLVAVVGFIEIHEGHLTLDQVTSQINKLWEGPGDAIGAAISPITTPIVLLGAFTMLTGLGIAYFATQAGFAPPKAPEPVPFIPLETLRIG